MSFLRSRQLLPASGTSFPNAQWHNPRHSWPDRVILPGPGGARRSLCIHCAHFNVLAPHQVQETFAFIPDDGSATYVLNVETNTTQVLAGPSTKDAGARYFASTTALVQLDSQGDVSYLLVSPTDTSANSGAKWGKVVSLANAAPPTSSISTSSSTAAKPTGTSRSSSNNSNASASTAENGAIAVAAPGGLLGGLVGAAMLACAAVLF